MKNKKGFTLIELLAVIVILGLLLAIAIPSITKYIVESRKKSVVSSIDGYMSSVIASVNNQEYKFTAPNTIYAIPIECIPLEKGGKNPLGEWLQVNDEYWAYVLVQYSPDSQSYTYGFTFKDSAGFGMYPISIDNINEDGKDILANLNLANPQTGLANYFSDEKYWKKTQFTINEETRVKVIQSRLEGDEGDGQNTCTLRNKGQNYEEIKKIKTRTGTMAGNGSDKVFGKEMDRSLIEEIYTLDYIDVPTDAIDSWDASSSKNGAVMAYITDNDKDDLYELYLAQEGGVIAPTNSQALFNNYNKVIKMDLTNFNTSKVTNMYSMFYGCSSLKSLDLSSFDTANVKTMTYMFYNCSALTDLNLKSFNTSNVTNIEGMFSHCRNLKSLELSSFNTSKVTAMKWLFRVNYSLGYLDISNFDFSNVKTMPDFPPVTCKIIVKDDATRNWIQTNISGDYTNIVTIAEL